MHSRPERLLYDPIQCHSMSLPPYTPLAKLASLKNQQPWKNTKPQTALQGLRLRFRLSHSTVGGLTISLNSAVPQTSSAKPSTCSHLNVSQPRPSETSQMKSVRHVSIVLRAVAEIWRVTERPKKLKPLVGGREC